MKKKTTFILYLFSESVSRLCFIFMIYFYSSLRIFFFFDWLMVIYFGFKEVVNVITAILRVERTFLFCDIS